MKKLSSKIIIFLLVTTFLWGGVNFNFEKNKTAHVLEISSAQAATTDAGSPGTAADKKSSGGFWSKFMSAGVFISDLAKGTAGIGGFAIAYAVLYLWSVIQALWLALAAIFFDGILVFSIQHFPTIVENSGVDIAWGVFRNIINISFIFILLYISISIIIGSIGPKAKSTLASVIIAALLINFSLFFTRILIDGSNILTVALFNSTGGTFGTFGTAVMAALDISALFKLRNLTASGQASTLFTLTIQITLMFILTWVYIKAGLLFLGRIVMLLILMTLSPIAFLGSAIPGLGKKASEWWTAFVGQLILAPAFIFILIIISQLLKKRKEINDVASNLFNSNGTYTGSFNIGPIIYYVLIIAILLAGMKMVKKLSGSVGEIVDKVEKGMKWVAAAAIAVGASVVTSGAAAGPAASMLGRMAASTGGTGLARAVGRGGLSLARSGAGQAIRSGGRAAADLFTKPGLDGDLARMALKGTLGTVKKNTGLDLEAANKDLKDYQKNYNKYAGEQANKIGPGEVDAEIKNRNETMENIESQAKNRLVNDDDGKKLNKTLGDTAKEIEDLTNTISGIDDAIKNTKDPNMRKGLEHDKETKQTELNNQQKIASDTKKAQKDRERELLDGLKKQIGQEMGYNTETHDAEMEILQQEKIVREKALNEHLQNLSKGSYSDKKAAETLRAAKGKYRAKSKEEEWLDEVRKKMKEDAKKDEPKDKEKEDKK